MGVETPLLGPILNKLFGWLVSLRRRQKQTHALLGRLRMAYERDLKELDAWWERVWYGPPHK